MKTLRANALIALGAVSLVFATSEAQGAAISGGFTFKGGFILNSNDLNSANQAISYTSAAVETSSGDFSALIQDTPLNFSPFHFDGPQANLITYEEYSFSLDPGTIRLQGAGGLIISGSGVITGGTLDPTIATFRLTTQEEDIRGVFSFSGSLNAVPNGVPDSGATLALLGASLVGLHGVRRAVLKARA